MASGLLDRLQAEGRLVRHEPAPLDLAADPERAHAVIRPDEIPLIAYPPELSFGMLRDAALLTLDIQAEASAAGFTLRDAIGTNIQFAAGRPILVDTLSIGPAEPGAPWPAYRQFCEHFLAPLALMARRDIRLGSLLATRPDGIPLELAARLLPGRTRLNPGLATHIRLHARAQRRHEGGGESAGAAAREARVGRLGAEALIDSLRRTVAALHWEPNGTEWADYDRDDDAATAKDAIVRELLIAAGGEVVWDLGANVGRHSAIAAELGRRVVALDVDPAAVERHYRALRERGETRVLPLLVDVANPTPATGWGLTERRSLLDRADADVVLALALIHHLAIGDNIPLDRVSDLFAGLGAALIVEWVDRDDPMVRRLLSTREDVFRDYHEGGFRTAFGRRFTIEDERPIPGTHRVVYRLSRRA